MNAVDHIFPTPYAEVNLTLQTLLDKVRAVLDDYFIGLYLYGSLAGGDFETGRSDIDFLVVTSRELTDNLISELKNMHAQLYEKGPEWAKKMSGAYIPVDGMRKYCPLGPACPMVNKNEFLVACPDPDWVIHRHILYTGGVVITGPPLQSMIDPVRPEELREAVKALLRNNWMPWLTQANLFVSEEYQPYVVLTMCRALYTLEHGDVATKRISAEWAIKHSGKKWTKLIGQAIEWRHGDPAGDIRKTQEFMRHVFNKAGV